MYTHVFFVHSSITEIIAHRISTLLFNKHGDNCSFYFLVGRNHKCSLLPKRSIAKLDHRNQLLGGYQDGRGSIHDFAEYYYNSSNYTQSITSYSAYVPHTKLRISRALIMNPKCKNYYVYEEGSLSLLSPIQLVPLLRAHFKESYSTRDKLYIGRLRIKAFFSYLVSNKKNKNHIVSYYLRACFSGSSSIFHFDPSKYSGAFAVSATAFPSEISKKVLVENPTRNELSMLEMIRTKYSHLFGMPILLAHISDSSESIAEALDSFVLASNSLFIFRPHPSLSNLSLEEICKIKKISFGRVANESFDLLWYPLEVVMHSLRSPLINAKNSSANMYYELYNSCTIT